MADGDAELNPVALKDVEKAVKEGRNKAEIKAAIKVSTDQSEPFSMPVAKDVNEGPVKVSQIPAKNDPNSKWHLPKDIYDKKN